MVTVEVDGVRVECIDAKDAAKCVREASRKAKKAHAEAMAFGDEARGVAVGKAYRILHCKATGRPFPGAWRLYEPHHKWAENMFRPLPTEFGYDHAWRHEIQCEAGWTEFHHYGSELVGVVCGGAGWAMAVVLRERHEPHAVTVLAVGASGGQISLADCPGVVAGDFSSGSEG